MYIMLYAMIAGSIVEITYNYYFFTALMTIFVASEDIQSGGIEKDEKQSVVCCVNGALTREVNMRVGIMSMQRVVNHGSFMQAYGLKSMIESLGHEVLFR